MDTELGLSDLLREVRRELLKAASEHLDDRDSPLFRVNNVTLTANVMIREVDSGSGGVDLKLVAVKMSDHLEMQKVHSIVVELSALNNIPFGLLQDKVE